MAAGQPVRTGWRWHLAALALCLGFAGSQIANLGYGTSVNKVPYIANYRVVLPQAADATLGRKNLIAEKSGLADTPDKWLMRFKIYSVEPDDVINIMALARIKPGALKLDPGFYLYGGSYLYPLGGWYFALAKLGLVRLGGLDDMLAEPSRMDAVYRYGRLFVLIAFVLSALVLYRTLLYLAPPGSALMATAIYLIAPASIRFSQLMKPHWYALLWINLALLAIVRLAVKKRWGRAEMAGAGVATGLAVGAVTTAGLFAIGLWLAIAGAWRRGYARASDLILVPALALVALLASNPYMVLNWSGYQAERRAVIEGWFRFSLDPSYIAAFVANSLLPGLGAALGVLILGLAAYRLVRPSRAYERPLAIAVFVAIAVAGLATASLSTWSTNLRYAPYLLPLGLILIAGGRHRWRRQILATCVVLTGLQGAPMYLAHFDSDNPRFSTRLQAAKWIDANIPAGAGIRIDAPSPSPYQVPPFRLTRYRINAKDAAWAVIVEAAPALKPRSPKGFTVLVKRYRPRLVGGPIPLVFGFANPQISIYRTHE
ncbi:MAG: ArnT family glycosyltransferase [Alphaproteobacteria bacterium]